MTMRSAVLQQTANGGWILEVYKAGSHAGPAKSSFASLRRLWAEMPKALILDPPDDFAEIVDTVAEPYGTSRRMVLERAQNEGWFVEEVIKKDFNRGEPGFDTRYLGAFETFHDMLRGLPRLLAPRTVEPSKAAPVVSEPEAAMGRTDA
jgi:hypothetical protein